MFWLSLRGIPLQVIVKVASVGLTPESPRFSGGSWHVEGMRDEAIVATCCLYTESENVSETRLEFRTAVREPPYEQNDHVTPRELYGLVDGKPLVQPLGSCRTLAGCALAWPNTLQHRVKPFELEDKSRPGRRTILCFFLVNPTTRIISTASVPPQPRAWHELEIRRILILLRALSQHARILVAAFAAGGITYSQAAERRGRLMDERRAAVEPEPGSYGTEKFFERDFSLCEH